MVLEVENESFFFSQTQTETWEYVRSESRAAARYLFEVGHHINMLIVGG